MPLIRQNPPASTTFLHTGSKQLGGRSLMTERKRAAMLGSSLSGLPQKMEQLILSAMNFNLSLFLIVMAMGLLDAPIAPWMFFTQFKSYSVIPLSRSIETYLLSSARSSLRNLLRFDVPMGKLLKLRKIGYPSQTGMISIAVAPADTTMPEQRPVKQRGVTQLKAYSIFSTFNFLNITLAITSSILLSVNTFSSRMTVFPEHEQLTCEKNMLQRSSSNPFQYLSMSSSEAVATEGYLKQLPDLRVFLGTLSPTSPTLMNSPPNSRMISSLFVFSIIIYIKWGMVRQWIIWQSVDPAH